MLVRSPAMELLRAERMAAGGDAIARESNGRIVFVDGALPGELVQVEFTSRKKDFAKARVVGVVEASDARVVPPCSALHAGCGGCQWQHISLDLQRQLKLDVARDALRRTAKLDSPDVRLGEPLAGERIRTTVRAAVGRQGRAGFRGARSHEIITPDSCLVTHPLLDEMIAGGRFHETAEVVLRVGARTGERLAWGTDPFARISGLDADVAIGPEAKVTEIVHGHRLQASAQSFFQSSAEAAEAIATAAVEAGGEELASAAVVVDAYGGIGLLAATAVHRDARIILIERSDSSTADATVNLADREIQIDRIMVERWKACPADVVLADPARSGLGPEAVRNLVATGCSRIVLISCDPVAGARDAWLLGEAGFELQFTTVLDPFPHTPHMELVSRFDRTS